MLSTVTYADFHTYITENRLAARLYYFIHLTDSSGADYYFTDYHTQVSDYRPTNLKVETASFGANLHDGLYTIAPVRVTLDNTERPKIDNKVERFSDHFSASVDFETQDCEIWLGYQGITDTADLFPYFINGVAADFVHTVLTISFTVIDRGIFELPAIPNTRFTRASYENIDETLIGKPIPLIYGRWNYQDAESNRYGEKSFVPGYVVENDLLASDPEIVVEFAGHEIDKINKVFIFDENLNEVGEIQDTTTNDLTNARVTIDPNTHTQADFLSTLIYLYPSRYVIAVGPIGSPENAVDGSFDTKATVGDSRWIDFHMSKTVGAVPDLTQIFSDTTGNSTIAIDSVKLQIAGYGDGTASGSDVVRIASFNSTFTEDLDATAINALGDVASFNYTTAALQLVNARKYDGAGILFTLTENSGAPTSFNVIPAVGYYPLMADLVTEADNQLAQLATSNTYKITYLKNINKVRVTRLTGSDNFRLETAAYSADIGLTSTTGYGTTHRDGNTYTILDVPDGDFSLLKFYVLNNALTSANDFFLKGVRIKIDRRYRDYNIVNPDVTKVRLWGRRNNRRQQGVRTVRYSIREGTDDTTRHRPQIRITDPERVLSVREEISGARFFAEVDGAPTGATYFKKPGEIIKDILETQLSIAAGNINSGSFTTADTDTQVAELALYLAEETPAKEVLGNLAKYGLGFMFVNQEGKYSYTNVKSAYIAGDIDFTLYYRDILEPLKDNFKISRNPIGQVTTDIRFHFLYNWAKDEFNQVFERSITSPLYTIPEKNEFCEYCTNETDADTIAEYFSGNAGVTELFGRLRLQIEFTTLDPLWHFAELGDIVAVDSTVNDEMNGFGQDLTTLYFKVVNKRYDRRKITIKCMEVG